MSLHQSGHGRTPEQVHKAFLVAAERRMKRAMHEVEGEVRRRAPWRTGHLRQSITSTVVHEGTRYVGIVGTATRYAPFLEFGTGLYGPRRRLIVPVRARALRFPAGGSGGGFANGARTRGSAGAGFRASGQQRAGAAGARAQWTFRRSVRGVHPVHFFRDAVEITRGRVEQELQLISTDAKQLLEGK